MLRICVLVTHCMIVQRRTKVKLHILYEGERSVLVDHRIPVTKMLYGMTKARSNNLFTMSIELTTSSNHSPTQLIPNSWLHFFQSVNSVLHLTAISSTSFPSTVRHASEYSAVLIYTARNMNAFIQDRRKRQRRRILWWLRDVI